MTTTAKLEKIISGGQTGADRGGLDAARTCGIVHGGWCPRGRLAEDGMIPQCYRLQETVGCDYAERTKANVLEADATLIFSYGPLCDGSLLTAEFAHANGKPYLHIDLQEHDTAQSCKEIIQWVQGIPDVRILNIAGSRESKSPGISEAVKSIMAIVINQL